MTEPAQPPGASPESVREIGPLVLRSGRVGDTHILGLAGELDVDNAPDVQAELRRVEATTAEVIVLDLSELDFLDSTGMQVLQTAQARAGAASERLRMIRPRGHALRMLELTGLSYTLPFWEA